MPLENIEINNESAFLIYQYGFHAVIIVDENLYLSDEPILIETLTKDEIEALKNEILKSSEIYHIVRSIERENELSIMVFINANSYVMVGENYTGDFFIQVCKDIEEQELKNIENGFDDLRFVKIFRHLFDLQEKAKVFSK